MSVLMEFAIFPTDKGISVSKEVSKVIDVIRNSGVSYKLASMGTTIETKTMDEALDVLNKAYQVLEQNCNRVYATAKFDIRKGKSGRMTQKLNSIENKIGDVVK